MNSTTTAPTGPGLTTLQLKIGGMSCSFCAHSIEAALFKQKGVKEVHVSLAHEEALVRYRSDLCSESSIKQTLRALGFIIRDPDKVVAFAEQQQAIAEERRDLFTAASFALTMFAAMAAMWLGLWQMRNWHAWTAWLIATFVFLWCGRRIIRMARGAAWRGITNQHVLLSIAAVGAYIGGLLGTPLPWLDWYGFVGFPAVDFFGVVVFLTTYHLLSGYISMLVRTRASESVRRLLDMQAPSAQVVRDGIEQRIDIEAVVVGDRVRIRPGEKVPVDGTIIEGASTIDESLVTGESIPVAKPIGAEVIGGSINQSGTLLVEVSRIGDDSFLQQVARHVEEARAMKPGIIVLVDRVLRHYVPVVLIIALAALLFWGLSPDSWSTEPHWVRAIYAAVTVLVMGYPCALGMATPLALIRGGGLAAERGILIRSGEAFQILKDITHVVLDKTGTITAGHPSVVEIEPLAGWSEAEILRLAASAEAPSEHPLGRAIVTAATDRGLELPNCDQFQAVTGAGVEATVAGHRLLAGTERLLKGHSVPTQSVEPLLIRHEERAHTAILIAIDGEVAGIIAITDAIKADAAESVAQIKAEGLVPLLVTGDNHITALAVARQVGIEQIHSQILPQQKAEIIRTLQGAGGRIAMVGDGINDAPALMQADVGMAIGSGTDIAIESSDVVIIGNRVGAVIEARQIGAVSYRKTVQNLWLAFFFNGVGVPLATTGLVHPSWAMIAMAASVSTVLINSFGGRLWQHSDSTQPPAPQAVAGTDLDEAVIAVPSIHCKACIETIEASLLAEAGVIAVHGDAEQKLIHVRFRRGESHIDTLRATIEHIGYRVG